MNNHQLVPQILANCDISDAQHAGRYSICGLALRLRDLYKWEHRLQPWQEDPSEKVLDWIGNKETRWETISESAYLPLRLDGQTFDPFDTQAINGRLLSEGLFYGAGYAHGLKPTFFLTRILSREMIGDRVVWRLGREYARDLDTLPALCQDDQVVLRTETGRMFLWDQMVYVDQSARPALQFALHACCGITDLASEKMQPFLDKILKIQETIFIRHEIGELSDGVFDRRIWRQLVSDHAQTPVELLVRVLKDMLADTGPLGTLPYLIRRKDTAGIGLYMAFCRSITLRLFSGLKPAFAEFQASGDWAQLSRHVEGIRSQAVDYTREVLEICNARYTDQTLDAVRAAIMEGMQRRGLINS